LYFKSSLSFVRGRDDVGDEALAFICADVFWVIFFSLFLGFWFMGFGGLRPTWWRDGQETRLLLGTYFVYSDTN